MSPAGVLLLQASAMLRRSHCPTCNQNGYSPTEHCPLCEERGEVLDRIADLIVSGGVT